MPKKLNNLWFGNPGQTQYGLGESPEEMPGSIGPAWQSGHILTPGYRETGINEIKRALNIYKLFRVN